MGKTKPVKKVLGIDIGGASIKAAIVDLHRGALLSPVQVRPTPRPATPSLTWETIIDIVHTFGWNRAIGCGFPGVIRNGRVCSAANLHPEWIDYPITEAFTKLSRASVAVLNDADAAGLAEMQFGAGRSLYRRREGLALIFTLGTGIGSALFYRGVLIPNLELGHLELAGKEAEKYAAAVVRVKENLGWKAWGNRVDEYLAAIEKIISPDLIIIGGGVSASWEKFAPYLHPRSPVVPAQLKNDAGIIGAALGLTIPEFTMTRRGNP